MLDYQAIVLGLKTICDAVITDKDGKVKFADILFLINAKAESFTVVAVKDAKEAKTDSKAETAKKSSLADFTLFIQSLVVFLQLEPHLELHTKIFDFLAAQKLPILLLKNLKPGDSNVGEVVLRVLLNDFVKHPNILSIEIAEWLRNYNEEQDLYSEFLKNIDHNQIIKFPLADFAICLRTLLDNNVKISPEILNYIKAVLKQKNPLQLSVESLTQLSRCFEILAYRKIISENELLDWMKIHDVHRLAVYINNRPKVLSDIDLEPCLRVIANHALPRFDFEGKGLILRRMMELQARKLMTEEQIKGWIFKNEKNNELSDVYEKQQQIGFPTAASFISNRVS